MAFVEWTSRVDSRREPEYTVCSVEGVGPDEQLVSIDLSGMFGLKPAIVTTCTVDVYADPGGFPERALRTAKQAATEKLFKEIRENPAYARVAQTVRAQYERGVKHKPQYEDMDPVDMARILSGS